MSAQVTALGLVFNVLSGDVRSAMPVGMVIGTVSILAYTLFGGMWSVAVTDFMQMIILVVGLAIIAVFAGRPGRRRRQGDRARDQQGSVPVLARTELQRDGRVLRRGGITMMLGSIPQQDVFQRVMSANSVEAPRAAR